MALLDVADKKKAAAPYANTSEKVHAQWDFAKDGGAITDEYTVLEATEDCLLTGYHAHVKTAVTSGGSLTMDVGVDGGTEDLLMNGIAVASLTVDSAHLAPVVEGAPNVLALPLKLASGDKIKVKLLTAAATAGVVSYVFKLEKL